MKNTGHILNVSKLDGCAMPALTKTFNDVFDGGTIIQTGYIDLDGEAFPCLKVLTKSHGTKTLIAQGDDEGNFPGVFICADRGSDAEHDPLICLPRVALKKSRKTN